MLYIGVYSLIAIALLGAPRLLAGLEALCERHLRGWKLLVLPMAYLFLARLLLFAWFGLSNHLLDDWYNHAIILPAFVLGFVAAGFPLFIGGACFAYEILPTTAATLIGLTPDHVGNLIPLDSYLDMLVRMVLVFGLSFELPLLLVLLNFGGVISGKRMAGWWRQMVMGITVFAAVAVPSSDPLSMLALAAPITALFFIAVGISLFNDRRRGRGREVLDDDEASHLDLTPSALPEVESVPAPRALEEDYDDAT